MDDYFNVLKALLPISYALWVVIGLFVGIVVGFKFKDFINNKSNAETGKFLSGGKEVLPHHCRLPRQKIFRGPKIQRGAIWQCGECEQKWKYNPRERLYGSGLNSPANSRNRYSPAGRNYEWEYFPKRQIFPPRKPESLTSREAA